MKINEGYFKIMTRIDREVCIEYFNLIYFLKFFCDSVLLLNNEIQPWTHFLYNFNKDKV